MVGAGQLWFTGVAGLGALVFWIGTALTHAARPISGQTEWQATNTCTVWGAMVFKTVMALTPWIHVRECNSFSRWPNGQAFILMNHTSYLDFFVFAAAMPLDYWRVASYRCLMQARFLEMPIFGWAMQNCGAFPVHFVSDRVGVHTVDKEKQAEVMAAMQHHVDHGGTIGICPEGGISRTPPLPLKSFREGAFALPLAARVPVYSVAMVGCHEAWPITETFGGLAATVDFSIRRASFDYDQIPTKAMLARVCNAQMGNQVADIVAIRAGRYA